MRRNRSIKGAMVVSIGVAAISLPTNVAIADQIIDENCIQPQAIELPKVEDECYMPIHSFIWNPNCLPNPCVDSNKSAPTVLNY